VLITSLINPFAYNIVDLLEMAYAWIIALSPVWIFFKIGYKEL